MFDDISLPASWYTKQKVVNVVIGYISILHHVSFNRKRIYMCACTHVDNVRTIYIYIKFVPVERLGGLAPARPITEKKLYKKYSQRSIQTKS